MINILFSSLDPFSLPPSLSPVRLRVYTEEGMFLDSGCVCDAQIKGGRLGLYVTRTSSLFKLDVWLSQSRRQHITSAVQSINIKIFFYLPMTNKLKQSTIKNFSDSPYFLMLYLVILKEVLCGHCIRNFRIFSHCCILLLSCIFMPVYLSVCPCLLTL